MMVTLRGWNYIIYIISIPNQSKYAINMISIHKVTENVILYRVLLKGQKYAIYVAPTPKESKYTSFKVPTKSC